MPKLTPQNFDRLAKAMMQRHGVVYSRAIQMLLELKLHLECGDEICYSAAIQAAVLTAINTGKRAFRGGITISMPNKVPLRLPWPKVNTLNEVVRELGAIEVTAPIDNNSAHIIFGGRPSHEKSLRVLCDGWRGGIIPGNLEVPQIEASDFALGGIFGGAFAVARSFLSVTQISNRDITEATGFSLWRPDLPWLSPEAAGPKITHLPSKLWMRGLGHLGQAYAWTLGLLNVHSEVPIMLYLQDFDIVESGNWSAGLLCEDSHIGMLKTRMCADWLEKRGFNTRIVERPFDKDTHRTEKEPRVAFCGFDNAESRQLLEDAGFDLVVECGLGATLDRFDRIVLRTFPDASTKAREIWAKPLIESAGIDPAMLEQPEAECGIVLQEIAGKAISSAFTGACASALVVAELLRAIHGGKRCEFLAFHLRVPDIPSHPYKEDRYQLRVARNGTTRALLFNKQNP